MAYNFPSSPVIGQTFNSWVWDGEKWMTLGSSSAPVMRTDALGWSGMQINGSMEVSQEVGTAGTTTNGGYACDGWRLLKAGTMGTTLSASPVPGWVSGMANLMLCQVTTAQASLGSGDYVYIFQTLEGYRTSRLGWGTANAQPITIGFWTAHNRIGIYTGSICIGGVSRSYAFSYTQNASNVSQYNVITIPGCTDGTWPSDNTGSLQLTFAVAAGSGQLAPSLNNWLTTVYRAGPGQINGVAATSDIFRITGVVVLPGIEAPTAAQSPLIMRPYSEELGICERYFRMLGGSQLYGAFASATVVGLKSDLSCEMRVNPTVTLLTTTPLVIEVGIGSRTGVASTISNLNVTGRSVFAEINGFSGAAPQQSAYMVTLPAIKADARL